MRCVVEVAEVLGSAPREPGARMIVGASGSEGTIGGGRLEQAAQQIARDMLATGEASREQRYALGDSLGQCCGGQVRLRFTLVADGRLAPPAPRLHVMLFGAGHVGQEVARLLERLPCTATWVDARPEWLSRAAPPNVRILVEDEPARAVDDAPAGASFLVMTHSHAQDLDIVAAALRRGDARFVGLIGSETKAARFRARLRQRGLDAARLVCPVGLYKSGKLPAEVALSAVAQLMRLAEGSVELRAAADPAT